MGFGDQILTSLHIPLCDLVGTLYSSYLPIQVWHLGTKLLVHIISKTESSLLFRVLKLYLTLCDPMDYSPSAPLSMWFPRQEYWRGLPFPSPGHLPNARINSCLLHWQADSSPLSHLRGQIFDLYCAFNGKPLQYCLENPMNSMKRQKDMTLKDELPRSVGANVLLEISGEITPERMKGWRQSENNTQLWMWLVMEVKSSAVKSNIA